MPKSGHATRHTFPAQGQCHGIAVLVIGFVFGARLCVEMGGVDIGAGTSEQNAVHLVQQGRDIGHIRQACKDHRHGPGHLGKGAQVALACGLDGKAVLDDEGIADHADNRSCHLCRLLQAVSLIPSVWTVS